MMKKELKGFIECDYCGELFVAEEPFCPFCGKSTEEIIKALVKKKGENNSTGCSHNQ